jgi:hypothetical protein
MLLHYYAFRVAVLITVVVVPLLGQLPLSHNLDRRLKRSGRVK